MSKPAIHVSDAEATNDFASLLARVRARAEIIIEHGATPVAVVHPARPAVRTILDCIALLPESSTATVDPDFGRDLAAAIASHRERLTPPEWD